MKINRKAMQRDILKIDEEKCTGCGECVPNCHEGALQVIDGKVRLVSELMCDGLGACIGHCPEDAITIEKREAQPYDEITVISEMVHKGANTVTAHLKHLKDHQESGYLEEGMTWLEVHEKDVNFSVREVIAEVNGEMSNNHGAGHDHGPGHGQGPGSRAAGVGRA
jgi:NAD-dependent dihydropyrimidine dehydrogenase PreA subunit